MRLVNIPPGVPEAAAAAAAGAGRKIIEGQMEKVAKKLDQLDVVASESFDLQSTELRISCPESLQEYSLALVPKQTGLLSKSAKFEFGQPRRVSMRSVVGTAQPQGTIVSVDNGFHINIHKLKAGQLYILDVEYALEDPRFIEALVSREHPRESVSEDKTSYWMVAQMKHLEALKKRYNRLELRDIDFNVDVGVHQDVETKVPSLFKEQLETIRQLVGPLGRDETFNMYRKLLALKSQKYGTKAPEILGKLGELFTSLGFRRYLEATQDFIYSDCHKGVSLYDFPINIWPKFMTVTSRTDLRLDKPAANGYLNYKKKDFLKTIEDIFA